jgi:rhodanese-related sulfurtransferase
LIYIKENKILDYKKIFAIIISGTFLGLVFNYFNPAGIPLIREKLELQWAPDSLFMNLNEDDLKSVEDSSLFAASENNTAKNISGDQSEEYNTQVIKSYPDKPKNAEEEIKETVSFIEPQAITPEQAYLLYNKSVTFIDARDEADYIAGHISKSVNIPFDDFENHKHKLEKLSKDKPVVVYCGGTDCDLSHLLANLLFEKGYKQVYVFFGGWNDWLNANYPTEKSAQ